MTCELCSLYKAGVYAGCTIGLSFTEERIRNKGMNTLLIHVKDFGVDTEYLTT